MSRLGAPCAGAVIADPGGGDPRYTLPSGGAGFQPAGVPSSELACPDRAPSRRFTVGPHGFLAKCYYLVPEAQVSCAGVFGCMRHLACCTVRFGVIEMRRAAYFLLVVFLTELSGLTTVCVPCRGRTHPCCPMPDKTSLPNRSSLPDCCVNYILNCLGSITEARDTHPPSEYTAQSAGAQVRSVVPFVAINRSVLQHVALPISPPLSPLSQSCLLLI